MVLRLLLVFSVVAMSSGNLLAQSQFDPAPKMREWVSTLCSPTYFGRGYEKNGCERAGRTIGHFLDQLQMDTIWFNRYQRYSFSVVEHAKRPYLKSKSGNILLGEHFIPHPASPKSTGKGQLVDPLLSGRESQEELLHRIARAREKNEFWIIPDTGFWAKAWSTKKLLNQYQVVFWEQEKLTGHIASSTTNTPSFYIHTNQVNPGDLVKYRTTGQETETEQTNIAGVIRGKSDSLIVLTAHYDHIGGYGKSVYVPGANDNASGTALLLTFAEWLSAQNDLANYSIAFVFFSGEEAGLKGSKYFVDNLDSTAAIKYVLNLDLVGTGEDGITVVNAVEEPELFDEISTKGASLFSSIKRRGQAANSDHYWFHTKGIPALFIYGMGKRTAYHDVSDTPETMPQPKASAYFELLKKLCYE